MLKERLDRLIRLNGSWERLKNSAAPVCIYGTGDACERILEQFARHGICCEGIFASDDFLRGGREFHGFEVTSLSELESRFGEITVCCAFGSSLPDVMAHIEEISRRHELIFPDLPVAGDELFTEEGLTEHIGEIESVCDMLSDELSRETLLSVLEFKLTGDISALKRVFSASAEFYELVKPRTGDVYADLGAYNGDTVESFIAACPDYGVVYAFEPDVRSFRRCVKRHLHREGITFINACAWSSDGALGFSQDAGRQSKIEEGGRLQAARSLDSVLGGARCDIIKLDVEGAEREALLGSARTIAEYSPRLIMSAYHRPYDLLTLPQLLRELSSDGYRLYVRQPPYFPAWDTCIFAVPKK
ncbi:MAG: FkbM family methyltransferase [Ruminococcus sp.]|nr:FkbM family methyltransferase [Ruminococcus sp.]